MLAVCSADLSRAFCHWGTGQGTCFLRAEQFMCGSQREQVCHVIRGCIQTFPDWSPAERTANSTALCHYMQLYRYFASQCSEFCRHNDLYCFSVSVYCCLFRYRLSPETFGYTLVLMQYMPFMRAEMLPVYY
jgi:hypothetical protein